MRARFTWKRPEPERIVYASLAGALVLLHFCFFAPRDDFGVARVVLLHFCFFARCDEFLSDFLQLAEDGYAGAIHGQNRSDRKSAVRRDLVAMGFGDFLNQAVGAQESKLAADRR
jgi:hypothetical protein